MNHIKHLNSYIYFRLIISHQNSVQEFSQLSIDRYNIKRKKAIKVQTPGPHTAVFRQKTSDKKTDDGDTYTQLEPRWLHPANKKVPIW